MILSVVLKEHLQGSQSEASGRVTGPDTFKKIWLLVNYPLISKAKFHVRENLTPGFHSRLSSMVLNKVRLTEDSLFDNAKPELAKALHKGWLMKNPIAERDSMSVNILTDLIRASVHVCMKVILHALSALMYSTQFLWCIEKRSGKYPVDDPNGVGLF